MFHRAKFVDDAGVNGESAAAAALASQAGAGVPGITSLAGSGQPGALPGHPNALGMTFGFRCCCDMCVQIREQDVCFTL